VLFEELKQLISKVVSAFYQLFPTCHQRSKTHMMLHLVEDYIRFGCSFLYDVECFESLNKISRNAIISSNATDDARAADKYWTRDEASRHLLAGGMWCIKNEDVVHSPGSKLVQIVGPLFSLTVQLQLQKPIPNAVYLAQDGLYLMSIDESHFAQMDLTIILPLGLRLLSKTDPPLTRNLTSDDTPALKLVKTITMKNQLYLNKFEWR
jgi:hypothetical protein